MCKSVADFKADKSLTTHQTQHTHTHAETHAHPIHVVTIMLQWCAAGTRADDKWAGTAKFLKHESLLKFVHLEYKKKSRKNCKVYLFQFSSVWVIIQDSKYTFSHSICAWHRKNLLGYLANCFIHDHGTFSYLNQCFIFVMVHARVFKFPCQWALRDHYSPASEHCKIKHHTNKMTHVCILYIKILLEVNAR